MNRHPERLSPEAAEEQYLRSMLARSPGCTSEEVNALLAGDPDLMARLKAVDMNLHGNLQRHLAKWGPAAARTGSAQSLTMISAPTADAGQAEESPADAILRRRYGARYDPEADAAAARILGHGRGG